MITPPTCKTYLTTDFDDPNATQVTFEAPEGSRPSSSPGSPSRSGQQLPAAAQSAAEGRHTTVVASSPPPSCGSCFAGLWSRASRQSGRRQAQQQAEEDLRR